MLSILCVGCSHLILHNNIQQQLTLHYSWILLTQTHFCDTKSFPQKISFIYSTLLTIPNVNWPRYCYIKQCTTQHKTTQYKFNTTAACRFICFYLLYLESALFSRELTMFM